MISFPFGISTPCGSRGSSTWGFSASGREAKCYTPPMNVSGTKLPKNSAGVAGHFARTLSATTVQISGWIPSNE